jgi:hypothetical protein
VKANVHCNGGAKAKACLKGTASESFGLVWFGCPSPSLQPTPNQKLAQRENKRNSLPSGPFRCGGRFAFASHPIPRQRNGNGKPPPHTPSPLQAPVDETPRGRRARPPHRRRRGRRSRPPPRRLPTGEQHWQAARGARAAGLDAPRAHSRHQEGLAPPPPPPRPPPPAALLGPPPPPRARGGGSGLPNSVPVRRRRAIVLHGGAGGGGGGGGVAGAVDRRPRLAGALHHLRRGGGGGRRRRRRHGRRRAGDGDAVLHAAGVAAVRGRRRWEQRSRFDPTHRRRRRPHRPSARGHRRRS